MVLYIVRVTNTIFLFQIQKYAIKIQETTWEQKVP